MGFSCVPDVFNEVVADTSVIVVLIVVVVVMVAIIVVVVGVDVVVSNFETDKNHQIDENGFGNWNLIFKLIQYHSSTKQFTWTKATLGIGRSSIDGFSGFIA